MDAWDTLDFAALDRLRERFLDRAAQARGGVYWTTPADLAAYDLTFGERIGWKWDAVLAELRLRGWQPPAGSALVDWGCGSGIAGRRVAAHFGPSHFVSLQLWDHSPLALDFASRAAYRDFPRLPVDSLPPNGAAEGATVVVSHVLNELIPAGADRLRAALLAARSILWLEPGTFDDSRALIAWREELIAAGFVPVAPCSHAARCGMLNVHNARHWCHHFAVPPPGVTGDPRWTHFARRMGIDLRATPYSFIVLERAQIPQAGHARQIAPPGAAWTRVIGAPRVYKGYARILGCTVEDVAEVQVQARDHAGLFRRLKKGRRPTLFRAASTSGVWTQIGETLPAE